MVAFRAAARALGVGGPAVGAPAVGSVAMGALAVGALAVVRLALGRWQVEELRVARLHVGERTVDQPLPGTGGGRTPTGGRRRRPGRPGTGELRGAGQR
jgi:hypothetical protein